MAAGKQLTPWFGHDRTVAQQMMGLDRLFAEVKGKTVLDVGCAEGAISIECARRGADVHGIEIRPQAVAEAKKAVAQLRDEVNQRHALDTSVLPGLAVFHECDANNFEPHFQYSVILLLAVLHKLRNPTATCARIVKYAVDLVVIRLPPEHAPTIIDERSGNEPHHIDVTMDKAGFDLEHESNDGPFGEWVGYYRRRK